MKLTLDERLNQILPRITSRDFLNLDGVLPSRFIRQ